jgi:hypothetical protein
MVHTTNAAAVISYLKSLFAKFGIPLELICDNGPPFNSYLFHEFAKEVRIQFRIVHSSPYHSRSNGLAEKAVHIMKDVLKKCASPTDGLAEYRATPVTGVGLSPSEMLMGRLIRTKIPVTASALCVPPNGDQFRSINRDKSRVKMKTYYDSGAKEHSALKEGQSVRMKTKNGWQPAVVSKVLPEPRSYIVSSNGRNYRRNRVLIKPALLPYRVARKKMITTMTKRMMMVNNYRLHVHLHCILHLFADVQLEIILVCRQCVTDVDFFLFYMSILSISYTMYFFEKEDVTLLVTITQYIMYVFTFQVILADNVLFF